MAKKFLIDVDKCSACGLCVVACKDEHVENTHLPWTGSQPATDHFWMKLNKIERGGIPRVRLSALPINCQHCENAPCMTSCSQGAIKRRDDGLVWIDSSLCNGCGDCQKACPYDVIYFNKDLGVAQKCTGCAHRVDVGELPRCAEVCPHEAIQFGDEVEIDLKAALDGRPPEILHPEYGTKPRITWQGLPRPWIAGMVVDGAEDEVIAGASIVVIDRSQQQVGTATSDEFGDFWIKELRYDESYSVSVTKAGYQSFQTDVTASKECDLGTILLGRHRS